MITDTVTETVTEMVTDMVTKIPREGVHKSIRLLQGPILSYVSEYVPAEFDASFRDEETWIKILSDVIGRGSSGSTPKPGPTSSFELTGSRPRCLHRPTEFQKKVALVIVVLLIVFFFENQRLLEAASDKIRDKKWEIVEKAVKFVYNKYNSKLENAEKKREMREILGDVGLIIE